MKKIFSLLSAFALLFAFMACDPDDKKNGGSQDAPEELTITGDAMDVTDVSATLTGYANLPFELGDAEVGIMYDKNQSFEDVKKVVATGLDGNNKFTVIAIGLSPSTTYYYKSYVQNGMAIKYGAVKSFTTKKGTSPIFEFSGTTVYDGQKAFLGTTATCDIGWETDSPTIVDLTCNEHGKNCIATFQLPYLAKKVTTVKITATNLEDDTVEPYTGEITVAPWRLTIYKKGSDNKWNKVDAVYNTIQATFSYGASGNGAGTYKLQLEYLDKDNNYNPITSIPYRLAKLETFKVRWTGKLIGINGYQEEDVYSKEFTLNALPASGERVAAAYIGGEVGFTVTVSN